MSAWQTSMPLNIYVYIYMCVCVCVLFGPVKPELGVIPSGQKKKKKLNSEHLNFPGKELNVSRNVSRF